MYCTACGQSLAAGATACPRCGRPFQAAAAAAPAAYVYDRVHRHLHILSLLWIIYAVWLLLHWATIFPFLTGIFGHSWNSFSWWGARMPWILPFITLMLVARAILSAAAGLALMQRAPWARTLAIVAAVFMLLKPITGTALAIYTFWVLGPALSGNEYDAIAVKARSS